MARVSAVILLLVGLLQISSPIAAASSVPVPIIITRVTKYSTRNTHSRRRFHGSTWRPYRERYLAQQSSPVNEGHKVVVEVGSIRSADKRSKQSTLPIDTAALRPESAARRISKEDGNRKSTLDLPTGSKGGFSHGGSHSNGRSQVIWGTEKHSVNEARDRNRETLPSASRTVVTAPRGDIPTATTGSSIMEAVEELHVRHHPFINDKECPRKPDQIRNRKCFKKCHSDDDCRGRNKQCLCDDVCGRSCVKPTRRCQTLKALLNGNYEIKPFNTFGAVASYSCNPGFLLSGTPERICQGDGYWSLEAPTCEVSDSAPALLGKCSNPPIVQFAKHDGPPAQKVFPLGIQLTYSCADGYTMDGFFRAMCVGEGRWVGPRMTCSPRRCQHPGDIPNGRREGNSFVFPNRVTYTCAEGYELKGDSTRQCLDTGKWSGIGPICKPVTCPPLHIPANGQMMGKEFLYGAVVQFSCFRGFQLAGSNSRTCQQDGVWSGVETTCATVDCGFPGPFYDGFLKGQLTTFGARIEFKCFGRTRMEGTSNDTTCLENGMWSHELPKCWRQCEIPSVINGTVEHSVRNESLRVGMFVDHNATLNFICRSGFHLNSSDPPRCYNGTWTFIPSCKPAPCIKSPPPNDVRDGIVRYHGNRHDDKAKYKCNTGYEMVGNEYIVCQYGEWVGAKPTCRPVYCDYPGKIKNGQILLVGAIGKYEYRHYVSRIGQNEQIEYRCNKGYKLIGPVAATCVDGQWSPRVDVRCVLGQHPKMMYMFRGKRDLAAIQQDHDVTARSNDNRASVIQVGNGTYSWNTTRSAPDNPQGYGHYPYESVVNTTKNISDTWEGTILGNMMTSGGNRWHRYNFTHSTGFKFKDREKAPVKRQRDHLQNNRSNNELSLRVQQSIPRIPNSESGTD